MRQKLTLVVTCTGRKSLPVAPGLKLRGLADNERDERVELWTTRLNKAAEVRHLRRLYQGETWSQVSRLERAADSAGFNPRVVVVSAGLGLQSIDALAPAYAATFSAGHADSVPGDVPEMRWWWNRLNETSGTTVLLRELRGPVLLVLSERYSRVLAPDIRGLAQRNDVLVIGGSADLPAHLRLPADRALRSALGGTATSLNARMAVKWLERLKESGRHELVSDQVRRSWSRWANAVRRPDVYARQPLSDEDVLRYVRTLRNGDPKLSKTRALRQLRDAGHACEQRRFGELFEQQRGAR